MSAGWAPYLDADENLLWEGSPSAQLLLFRPIDALLIPFAAIWISVPLFAAISVGVTAASPAVLLPLLFVAVGLYLLVGRFFVDAYKRRRTVYALSSKRAFIASRAWGRTLRDLALTPGLEMSWSGGARGTVTFGPKGSFIKAQNGFGIWTGDDGSFSFVAVQDPEALYLKARDIVRGQG